VPTLKRRLEMGGPFEMFRVDLLVAGFANVSADVRGCAFLTCGAVLVGVTGEGRPGTQPQK
jgi:hypothetical protein